MADDGKDFVGRPDGGGIDYGVIDGPEAKAANLRCGPIRLQFGYPGSGGFGCRHIESNTERMKQLKGAGYSSVPKFCHAVASNFTVIGEGQKDRHQLLWKDTYHHKLLVVQWNAGGYWTIVTAVIGRTARQFKVIYEVARTGGSEPTPDVAQRPRFETLSLPEKGKSGSTGS